MKIGIIVAMEKELRQLQQVFGGEQAAHAHRQYIIQQCGIGKVNAAIGTAEMIREHRPDVIISSGCAGGNGDEVQVQDVVVSTQLAYHDVYCGTAVGDTVYGQVQGLPARYDADPMLLSKAKALESQLSTLNCHLHSGLIVTGDWFVDTKEKARDILGKFPEAKAIDMESAAIAQTCYIYQVPFISFRVVSDIPLRDTDASQYHDFWNRIAENSFQVTRQFVESF